uniref:Uncharacterized protein n=1 Tax=Panagrolaimus superbus TaxID=310955 RepID=A0A914YS55_9BILA
MNISMEKEMKKLNQKLNETETLFYQLQTDIKLIEDEKTYFENLNKLNESEFVVYKKSSVEESNNLEEKIAHLSAELAKCKEENKTLTKSVEKSQSAIQEALKNPNVENAESQTQTNVENEEILKKLLWKILKHWKKNVTL